MYRLASGQNLCKPQLFRLMRFTLTHQISTMPALALLPRQPPVAPLTADAQQALADLQRPQKITKRLTHHLTQAADQLANVAEQLNDRGARYTVEYQKKRRRAEANGEEEDEQEKTGYEDFQKELQDLTRTMDNGVRAVVDDQTWVDGLPEIMTQIGRKATASAEASRRHIQHVDGGEEDEDGSASTFPPAPAVEDVPSALLNKAREDLAANWASKTLTERYSQHNTYVGFYRSVHDARNLGEDGPPIPHHSLWFASEEDVNPSYVPPGTQSRQTRRARGPANEEDDEDLHSSDVEIARERISIKCPITFLPYTDPLTSTKCPHSFDRPGIMDMLHRTPIFFPLTDAQTAELAQITNRQARSRREAEIRSPRIHCPVCSIPLAETDLRPDPALLRKVQRIQAAEARQMEAASSDLNSNSDSSDDDDEGIVAPGKGTQRKPVGLDSSPPRRGEKEKRIAMEIKKEKERARSKSRGIVVVPQTQVDGGHDEEMDDD